MVVVGLAGVEGEVGVRCCLVVIQAGRLLTWGRWRRMDLGGEGAGGRGLEEVTKTAVNTLITILYRSILCYTLRDLIQDDILREQELMFQIIGSCII